MLFSWDTTLSLVLEMSAKILGNFKPLHFTNCHNICTFILSYYC